MAEPAQLSFDFIPERELAYREFAGRVTKLIYDNPKTSWKVIAAERPGGGDPVKLAGFLPNLDVGESFHARCSVTRHPRFGECWQVDVFEKDLPFVTTAVAKFMVSQIDGIGEVLAERIVSRFGNESLEVLEQEPEKLLAVEGITAKKLEKIKQSTERVDEVVKELILAGFSPKWAGRIYLKYGKEAPGMVKRRPYKLIRDFKGIGFKKADVIARNVGIDKIDEERITAGIYYTLNETLQKTGHNFLYLRELVKGVARLLGLPRAYCEAAILSEPKLVIEEDRVYLPKYYQAEWNIARSIAARLHLPEIELDDFAGRIAAIEREIGITFSDEQRDAIRGAAQHPVTVITGAAGTGKSTLCRGLLALLTGMEKSFEVCAPTGKAANKLANLTGARTSTVHRLFKYAPFAGFRVNRDNPLAVDYLIVDEASMVDLLLMDAIFSGVSGQTRLVFIGDPHQLPPVDSGNSLQALVGSYSVSQVVLPRIFRQARESMILRNASMINLEQPFPRENHEDFTFIDTDNPVQMVWELFNSIEELEKEGYHPIRDINVLTPLNKGGGDISVANLNRRLRDKLNPLTDDNSFYVFDREFRLGDKVMQRRNDYELDIFNGDIGIITDHDKAAQTVTIDFFGDERQLLYHQFDNIVLNYAMTVHKSQGSEARAVIFLATRAGCFFLLNKNLFYTAMTRAKEKLVMIMPYEVVRSAVRFNLYRQSYLSNRIQQLVIGGEKGGGGGQ